MMNALSHIRQLDYTVIYARARPAGHAALLREVAKPSFPRSLAC